MSSELFFLSQKFCKLASDFYPITEALQWRKEWVNLTEDDFQFLIFQISQNEELSKFGAQCLDKLATWADTSRQALFAFVFDLKKFAPDNNLEQEIKRFLSQFKKYLTDLKAIKENYPDVFSVIKAMMDYVKFCALYESNEEIPVSLYAGIIFSNSKQIAKNLFRHMNAELSENGSYVTYDFYLDELKKAINQMTTDDSGTQAAEQEVKNSLRIFHSSLKFVYPDINFNNFTEWLLGILEQKEWQITKEEICDLMMEEFNLPKEFYTYNFGKFFVHLSCYQHLLSFKEKVKDNKNDFLRTILNLN
jgi:hypothetical protein